MSNQEAAGGNLPNFDPNQLTQLLNQLGGGEAASAATAATKTEGTTENKRTSRTEDTSARSEDTASSGTIANSDSPELFPPVQGRMGEPGTGQHLSDGMQNVRSTATLEATDGVQEQIEKLSDEYPAVKLLLQAADSEEEAMALLNEALEEMGITPPINVSHPKMPEAIKNALAKKFEELGMSFPDEKAQVFTDQLEALRTVGNYAEYIGTIDPTGKSFNEGKGLEKVIGIVGAAGELVDGILDELKSGRAGDNMAILEFLEYIAELIADLKGILSQIHIEDSKKSGKIARAIVELQSEKREAILKSTLTTIKSMNLKGLFDDLGDTMKVLGPVLSAAMILTALLFLPVAPVVTIVMVTLALAMLGSQVALTETGVMEDIFEFANEQIGQLGKKMGMSEDLARVLVWVGILAGIIVATALLMLVPQVGLMIPMLAMPILTTIITESGFIEIIVKAFADEVGMSEKLEAILSGLFTALITVVLTISIEILALILAFPIKIIKIAVKAIFTGGVSLTLDALKEIVKNIGTVLVKAAITLVKAIFKLITKVLAIITKILTKIAQAAPKLLNAALKTAKNVLNAVKKAVLKVAKILPEIGKALINAAQSLKHKLTNHAETLKAFGEKVKTKIKNIIENIKKLDDKLTKVLEKIHKAVQISGQVAQSGSDAAANVGMGAITMNMAKLTEEQAELDYILTLLSELIKSLESLMASLQGGEGGEGVGEFMAQINNLSELFESIIASMSGITGDLASSAMV